MQDLLRTAGLSIVTAGLLFGIGISSRIPLEQLITPMAIGIMIALGLAAGVADLVILLRNPKRLAIARYEKMPSPEDVQKFQWQISGASDTLASTLVKAALTVLVFGGTIVYAIFWR